jgi:hypothetical protein
LKTLVAGNEARRAFCVLIGRSEGRAFSELLRNS